MRGAAVEAGRDPDAIKVISGAAAPPGDKLYSRIQELSGLGVDQVILPAFPPEVLAQVGADLVSRFG